MAGDGDNKNRSFWDMRIMGAHPVCWIMTLFVVGLVVAAFASGY